MNVSYLLPGITIASFGFVILFGLLASVSALAKSKQLSALGSLASGRAGKGKRVLFFVAIGTMLIGSCGVFGGIAKSDGARARACQQVCVEHGHTEGRIGPSARPAAKHPVAACVCRGGPPNVAAFETSVDDLAF